MNVIRSCKNRDFPGGPVLQPPPCSQGNMGSMPGWGTKVPHTAEQLSPHTATVESEHHNERIHALQGKSPHDATKT